MVGGLVATFRRPPLCDVQPLLRRGDWPRLTASGTGTDGRGRSPATEEETTAGEQTSTCVHVYDFWKDPERFWVPHPVSVV